MVTHPIAMTSDREQLLRSLAELSEAAPDLRLGQMLANLATLALGAKPEAVWDAEDEQLLRAAHRLLERYRSRQVGVA